MCHMALKPFLDMWNPILIKKDFKKQQIQGMVLLPYKSAPNPLHRLFGKLIRIEAINAVEILSFSMMNC